MGLTIDERKERYYKLVLEKANKIYSSWGTNGITSKQLVAKANAYAFDNRLKTNADYRFYTLAFAVALGIRLEKRYGTFFRRLFRFFAYIRERAALKTLKSVLGFHSYTDIREMTEVEAEKIIVLLSQQENRRATGGGKRFETGDITLDEALNSFFNECIQEDEPTAAENNVDTDKVKNSDDHGEPSPMKLEEAQREKISVEELENGELVGEQKKKTNSPTKIEKAEKETAKMTETDVAENKKAEKPVEKTVASTSILAETMVLEQGREEDLPSPFPVFREKSESKTAIDDKKESVPSKEKNEPKIERGNDENANKDIHAETNRDKSPFPVFHGEKTGAVKAPEKAVEREIKENKEIKEIKEIKEFKEFKEFDLSEEKTLHTQAEISDENKVRIALNVTMRNEEIQAIVEQLKAAANVEMQKEEQAWREKISIESGGNETKLSVKENAPSSNKGAITPGPKK